MEYVSTTATILGGDTRQSGWQPSSPEFNFLFADEPAKAGNLSNDGD
jgi:hypothetical protein